MSPPYDPPSCSDIEYHEALHTLFLEAMNEADPADREKGLAHVRRHHARLAYVKRAIMEMFPRWDRRVEGTRPANLPAGCNWWNGVSDFSIKSEQDGHMDVDARSYVAGGNYDFMKLRIVFPDDLHDPADVLG